MDDAESDLLRVDRIEAFFAPTKGIPVIVCYIENSDRQFVLYGVPPEIVIALNKIKGNGNYEGFVAHGRESLFDVLSSVNEFKELLISKIERVIIDELYKETGLFGALMELNFSGVIIQKRMIPSHAIFLAEIAQKPIFVKEALLIEQEKEEGRGTSENEGEGGT